MNNELKITATANVKKADSELQKLQNTLQGTGNVVTRVGNIFDKEGNLVSKTISTVERKGNKLYRTIQRLDGEGNLRGLSQSVTDVKDKADTTTKKFSLLRKTLGTLASATTLVFLGKQLYEMTTKAIDYSESLNLFNTVFKNIKKDGETVFSDLGKQATEFQDKMEKNFGTNRTESMYFQGLYQSMAESQGIVDKYAYIMSENSTKLTYDLSSLFNKNQEDTAEALRAGIYAGQTKPLRSYGIDITETSLQKTLDKIKETNSALEDLEVSSMSQAEKQILRYLTVLEQASVAHGDFANTIESPANQLKIFGNQIVAMGVAIGNLLVAPLQKLLSFANTVVIVIKQVAEAIASMFGIKSEDYNTGIASAEDLSDSFEDVGDSASGASKKIKELKRETLAFDNINNINENKNKNGDNGSSSGGINQALLDSLKGYDNGLDRIKLKAQEVADTIMKWLGFTYDAEKGVWELGSAYDNLKKSCKKLGEALSVLGKYSFDNLINFYNNFLKPVGKWTLGTGLPKFVEITANGIMKTDWSNLNKKLNDFYKALAPFTINVGEGLLWFYEKVLVPLGSFTIGKIIPEFVELLSNGITILNNSIETAKPTLSWIWDSFLSPMASFTGGVVVNVLKDINDVLGFIAKNKALSTFTTLATVLLLIKKNGGLASGSMSLLSNIFGSTSKEGQKLSDVTTDKKRTGLGKIFGVLFGATQSLLSPMGDLASSVKNASTQVGDVSKKTEKSGSIFSGFKSILSKTGDSTKNLGSNLKDATSKIGGMSTKLNNGVASWYNTSTAMDKTKVAIVGIGIAMGSLGNLQDVLQRTAIEGDTAANKLNATASALGTTFGAMATGTAIAGPLGGVIGGVAGAFASVYEAVKNIPSGYEKVLASTDKVLKKNDEYVDSIKQQRKAIENQMDAELSSVDVSKQQYEQLKKIVDVNGQVKVGREEEASFLLGQLNEAYGTNYQLVDGVIQQYGEMCTSIDNLIAKKEAEVALKYKEEEYALALENRSKLEKTLLEDQQAMEVAANNLAEAENKAKIIRESDNYTTAEKILLLQKADNAIEQNKKTYDSAAKKYEEHAKTYAKSINDIENYQNLWVAFSNKNYGEAEKIVKNWDKNTYQSFSSNLVKQTQDLNGGALSENLKQSWALLAKKDHKAYEEGIKQLDPTTRKNIQSAINGIKSKESEMKNVASDIATKTVKKMNKKEQAKSIGGSLIQGLINGLSGGSAGLLSVASSIGGSLIRKFKEKLGINSPSKLTKYFGIQTIKGFGVGFDQEEPNLLKKASNFTNDLIKNFSLNDEDMKESLTFKADKFVNFSDISGLINTNNKMNFDNSFVTNLGIVIANAINNRPIEVDMNVTTEEGILVDKMIKGVNRITDMSGECPIRVM